MIGLFRLTMEARCYKGQRRCGRSRGWRVRMVMDRPVADQPARRGRIATVMGAAEVEDEIE